MNFVNNNKRIIVQFLSGIVLVKSASDINNMDESGWLGLIVGLIGLGAILSAASDYLNNPKTSKKGKNAKR